MEHEKFGMLRRAFFIYLFVCFNQVEASCTSVTQRIKANTLQIAHDT
jgi:hypothetical protein